MICCLRRVSNEKIEELLANPEEVVSFLWGPIGSTRPGLLARLFGWRRGKKAGDNRRDQPAIGGWPPAEDDCLDLDKAWHGIHYLLNFSDWEGKEPFCYLVKGGKAIGNVDVGYGPVRALRSGQVRRFRDALAAIGPEELTRRYDPVEMMDQDIYPTIWNAPPEDDDPLGYLQEHFVRLLQFLDRCVEKNCGLLVYLQ